MARRKIEVVIAGDAASLSRAFGKAGSEAQRFGSQVNRVHGQVRSSFGGMAVSAAKFAAVSAGFYGAGAAISGIAKATVGFDKSMRNVNSIAQLSEKRLGSLEKQVLKLAGKTAQSPQTLAKGLYDLVSSGFNANQSMKILAASAKAATAGLTTTEVSTKAVAAVLNAYHRPASAAANVSDVLFQTVNKGVISFDELAQTIGDVLPFSAALGVSVNEVGASISTMTKAGISAPETMTRIKSIMEAFIKPSVGMAKAIKATGAESGEALVKQKGFQGALESVIGTTNKSKSAVATLFPNIRALGGALALSGKNAKGAEKDLQSFKDVTGATDTALKQQRKSISYAWEQIKSKIEAASISVGSVLIPAVSNGLSALGGLFKTLKDKWADVSRTFGALKATHGSITGALSAMLTNAFQKVDWGGIAKTLGSGISTAFTAIPWAQIGSAMSAGLSKAFDFSAKLTPAIEAGITAAVAKVDGRAVLGKLVDVVGSALTAVLSPSFWIQHFGAIFSTVTFVIPVAKILKIPGAAFLFRFISKPIFEAVAAVGRGLLSVFGEVGARAFVGFISGLERSAPRIATAMFRLVNNGVRPLSTLAGKVSKLAGAAASAIVSRIGGAAAGVASAVGRIAGSILRGIAAITAPARARMGRVAQALIAPLHDVGARFVEIGRNLIQGLINGIKSMAGVVADAAKGVVKGAVDAAKKALHIGSPSKLFYQFGEWTMEGYIGGLLSKKEAVAAGLRQSLLYPIDAAIQALNDKKDKLQATWDAIDARAQRSDLVAAIRHAGSTGGGSGSGVASWAQSMVGHFSESSGKNTGPELDKLQATFHTKAAAWCAEFATTAAMMGGANKAVRTASVATAREWAQAGTHGFQKGLKKTPRTGDLVAFGNKHMGYVESVSGGKVHTIEGNTSAGKVIRRSHAIGVGDYLRPDYSGSPKASAAGSGGSALLTAGQKAYGAALAAKTKLDPKFIAAWLLSEESGGAAKKFGKAGSNNWLNIGPGRRYGSPEAGAAAAAKLLKSNPRYAGILGAKSVGGAISALVSSPWDAAHYHGGKGLRSLASRFGSSALGSGGGGSTAAASAQIAANEQKIYDLRKKARDLPAGKAHTAERKQIQDEIAALIKRNKELKATVKGSGAIADARKALKDFDVQARRAKEAAKIDLQIRHLEQLKAFKDAIKGARDQMHDLAGQAAQAWRSIQEKRIDGEHDAAISAIDGSAQSLELQSLQETDAKEQDKKTKEGLDKDYEDAKLELSKATTQSEKDDAEKKIKDAEDALEAYKRGKREDELKAWIENEKAKADKSQTEQKDGLDQQTLDYQAGLENQFTVLTDALEKRKITYTEWAKQVNGILAGYGLTVATDSGTESAVGAGPGIPPIDLSKWIKTVAKVSGGEMITYGDGHKLFVPSGSNPIHATDSGPQKRAVGGWVYPGNTYEVGELGRERFTPSVPGHISQASQTARGGDMAGINIEKAYFTGSRAARAAADRLAFRARFG
jgi:TP901 family phage tail tape measure protein